MKANGRPNLQPVCRYHAYYSEPSIILTPLVTAESSCVQIIEIVWINTETRNTPKLAAVLVKAVTELQEICHLVNYNSIH